MVESKADLRVAAMDLQKVEKRVAWLAGHLAVT